MPYIAQKNREKLDAGINRLAARIVAQARGYGYDGAFAGLLNYTCTRLAMSVVKQQFGKMRYWTSADLRDVQEYRR